MSGNENTIVVDAENMILGRLASMVAKYLLEGKTIYVVNIDKAVVSGKPQSIFEEAKKILNLRTLGNPDRGPKRHRAPNMIFREIVWGMLPKHNRRGREALRRLKIFLGFPENYRNYKIVRFKEADVKRLSGKYVYLIEISKQLGWTGDQDV
ncbi:MAG: 50S ribosomal protein L13 [Candidatus Methanomethylicia archaeon]|nr:50S ribosomal protein L13 [Candidatus Methanomethylicia archaeon]MCX8169081.1 50S ribosomal protein L13 [Candidatus Methanomethylicia archaeon]MDW7988813.1 50S ribosomal protein L13 [Nitrososphaerota archaeon]